MKDLALFFFVFWEVFCFVFVVIFLFMVYVRFKGIPPNWHFDENCNDKQVLCVCNSRSNENTVCFHTVCFRLLAVHRSHSRLLTQGPPPLPALTSAQTHEGGARHVIKLAVLLVPVSVCPVLLCSQSALTAQCRDCWLRSLHTVELSGAVNQFSSPVLLAFYMVCYFRV